MNQISGNERAGAGLSRRSVLRAGAHAAWAVPAISVASAAPAYAAVSGEVDRTPHLLLRDFRITPNNPTDLWRVSIVLEQTNLEARPIRVPDGTQVVLNLPKGNNRLAKPPTVFDVSAEFRALPSENTEHESSWDYYFEFISGQRGGPLQFGWQQDPTVADKLSVVRTVTAQTITSIEPAMPVTHDIS